MLIGHRKQWQFLKSSYEMDRLSHAYLFSGEEQSGKKTLAIEFTKWLFGEDIQKRQHPDFTLIEPLEKDYNPPTARGGPAELGGRRKGWSPTFGGPLLEIF